MPTVERTLRIKTVQNIDPTKAAPAEGFPMRKWSIEIYMVNESDGSAVPADAYEKAIYHLHPSFGPREKQTFKQPPFRCAEEGWGEFEMRIVLTPVGKGKDHSVNHDLNFSETEYEANHKVTFQNPKPELIERLRSSGPVPGDAAARAGGAAGAKKSRKSNQVDMDKLAEALQRLDEESLLQVVQLVHEQKSPETYTKNDVENGEFHVDLYTLPDALVKNLWEFTASKVDITAL